ncbi:MAG: SET domain-containing protein-lysine N-methyltransferase [Candidatus Aenigmarchaeota archaeon]|nr:SET domain-containing protein-lysine N-methyltransferase [Candidatus Aenigmarchaeota archaeon]
MKIKIVNGVDNLGKRLIAIEKVAKNEVICKLKGKLLDKPTWQTLQVGPNKHLKNRIIDYLNHSCNPNSFVDTEKLVLVANRTIKQLDDITINYLLTECELASPFKCMCGSRKCFKEIKGYKFLNSNKRLNIPYLLKLKSKLQ